MRQNLHELPAVIKMAGELGACSLQVAELVEYNLTRGQSLANDPLMAEWAKKAETEARKWRINLLLPANIPGRQVAGPVSGAASIDPSNPATYKGLRKTCKEPWENMFVQYNGEVRPCCVITESYGNLSTQTFEEVWYGPKYQALRAALLTDGPSTKCVQCPFYGWEPIDRPQSATPADKASSAMAPLEVESLPANPGTVVSDITVAASQPTKSTVQVRRGWKGLVRKLLGARQCAPQLSDLQLLCILNRLSCADPVAELERIRRGGHSISEACLALLERGQSLSNGAFVGRIYRSLLDREPDENGLQGYWQALDSGLTSRVEVVGSFISSAEFQRMLLSPQWIEHPR